MKLGMIIAAVLACWVSAVAQPSQTIEASNAGIDRMTVVKNSIPLDKWHEKPFWSLYDNYSVKREDLTRSGVHLLEKLADIDNNEEDVQIFDNAMRLLQFRYDELSVWQQYFNEVSAGHNGTVALQFLQTETLLNIMDNAIVYEQSPGKHFSFHPKALSSTQSLDAKHNACAKALSISQEQASAFFDTYALYEAECNDLLGENYNLYELFLGEPTDYTPAFGKKLGRDLLEVMRREIKLKEKYLAEMARTSGPVLAARFLAWEDYYSLVNKMYAWTAND